MKIRPGNEYIVEVTADLECIERAELIRCKDCIYFKEVSGWHRPICSRIIKNINADDYCSYAVKMPPVATIS